MEKKSLIIASALLYVCIHFATGQTPAGKSFFIDYVSWNAGSQPPVYIDCGTSNVFNTGYELTMEVWIRIYNSADNQKILGKVTNTFDNGYVLAMETGNYSEVWDPAHYGLTSGTIPLDSAWVHLATTYAASGQLTEYINGVNVGSIPGGSNQISSSTNPFIIGMAPWDLVSFQTFGYIDEVRIWSVARTQSEIQSTMFKHLQGNEAGLVAYYDFNQAAGTNVPDVTTNGNTGTVNAAASPYYSWQTSYAAIGDDRMYDMNDVNAVWFGKDTAQYNIASTINGLSLISTIQPKHFDYAVFGHNDSTGLSTTFLPAAASAGFKRLNREWYVNKGGNVNADMYFNLKNAASGGDTLPLHQPVQYYTLLVRDSVNQTYTALASANALLSGDTVVKFSGVHLTDQYYTIGVGSTQIANPSSVSNIDSRVDNINLYPNPSDHLVNVTNVRNAEIYIYNPLGCLVKKIKPDTDIYILNVDNYEDGIYFVQVKKENSMITKRMIIQKD